MTPDEFKAELLAIGWKQADFARRVGVDTETAYRWANGKTAVPRWVPQYLGMVREIARLHEVFVLPPKPGAEA
jgi:transcriptional regulator with XRE-family HTH domain